MKQQQNQSPQQDKKPPSDIITGTGTQPSPHAPVPADSLVSSQIPNNPDATSPVVNGLSYAGDAETGTHTQGQSMLPWTATSSGSVSGTSQWSDLPINSTSTTQASNTNYMSSYGHWDTERTL